MRREEKARLVKEKARARRSLGRQLSKKYSSFLEEREATRIPSFCGRTRVLRRRVGSLLRKKRGSATSAREVPAISKRLFGLIEDAKRLKVDGIDFDAEIEVLNDVLTAVLDKRLASRYNGECGYGEALLNAYIDIFITATLPKTSREFEAKPTFLVYPVTGSILELDVMLEDFRLAFEFQGEHHYTNLKVMAKDAFKLHQCAAFSRVLIPVNMVQLSGDVLADLIVNSIVAHCGIYDMVTKRTETPMGISPIRNESLFDFCKATQRIYLAKLLYGRTVAWLDSKASAYVRKMRRRHPISTTTPAVRLHALLQDLPVEDVYKALPNIRRYRASLRKGDGPSRRAEKVRSRTS